MFGQNWARPRPDLARSWPNSPQSAPNLARHRPLEFGQITQNRQMQHDHQCSGPLGPADRQSPTQASICLLRTCWTILVCCLVMLVRLRAHSANMRAGVRGLLGVAMEHPCSPARPVQVRARALPSRCRKYRSRSSSSNIFRGTASLASWLLSKGCSLREETSTTPRAIKHHVETA